MSDQYTHDLARPVAPHSVGDNRAVPRPGVHDGEKRDGADDRKQARGEPETIQGEQDHHRYHQKNREKLAVRHKMVLNAMGRMRHQVSRGYQHGVIAAVPSVVFASLVATISGRPLPLEGIAEFLMQWTPVPVANALLDHLGAAARPAALLGAMAILLLAAGGAGAIDGFLSRWSRPLGLAVAGGCLAIFLLLWFPVGLMPGGLLLVALYVVMLWALPRGKSVSDGRRAFLLRSGVIVGGAAVLLADFSLRSVLDALAEPRLFQLRLPRGLAVDGLADLVTPNGQFYRMDKVLQYPEIARSSWQLRIDGAVDRPLTLDYAALLRLPRVSRYVTMECVDNPVGGPLIGNALWTGVTLHDILRHAGARGDEIVFHAPDEYNESVPRVLALDAGAMVAYGMNGDVLPREHGYPARLILPGVYGFKSVKWLSGITISQTQAAGNWRAQGWTEEGRIHTTVRVDVVRREGPRILIAGIAFGGRRGIRAVQVRAGGGAWMDATLGPSLSPDSWVQWALWIRAPGPISLVARAVDGAGRVQAERRHDAYPDGATGWAQIRA